MKRTILHLINKSATKHINNLVVLQQNLSADDHDQMVVWHIVPDTEEETPIIFSNALEISVTDEFGNCSSKLQAQPGERFEFLQIDMDNEIVQGELPTAFLAETEIHNKLEYGAVTVNVYKEGKIVAVKPDLQPWQCAYFSFRPRLWIGILPGYAEGDRIDLSEVASRCTELSFEAYESASIVIRDNVEGEAGFIFELKTNEVPNGEVSYDRVG